MSNFVVGDIQGCYKPLKKLLKKAGFTPGTDTLWCVGDLVNRGPKSLDIVNQSSVQHDTVVAQFPGLLKTQQNVQAGIDLGMIFFRLRDAEQIIDLGQYCRQRIALPQYLNED